METRTTVLSLLRKARDLVSAGRHEGILEAISSLRSEASGPTRDLAYYAVLETAMVNRGDASLSLLTGCDGLAPGIELLDATIKRVTSGLH